MTNEDVTPPPTEFELRLDRKTDSIYRKKGEPERNGD